MMLRLTASLPAAMCALLLLCATPARGIELQAGGLRLSVPVTSLKESKFRSTTRQQYDFSCGSAALATLLSHHYGIVVSERDVFAQMFAQGDQQKIRRQGFSMLDMQRYLATRGLRADGFELPLEKLIEAKLPAIVLVTDKGYNHFVVIKGADDGRVLIGDPSSGTRSLTRERFNQLWQSKLLFVIHDFPGKVAFNGSDDWRAAPRAPLGDGVRQDQLAASLPKFGPGDF